MHGCGVITTVEYRYRYRYPPRRPRERHPVGSAGCAAFGGALPNLDAREPGQQMVSWQRQLRYLCKVARRLKTSCCACCGCHLTTDLTVSAQVAVRAGSRE